MNEKKILIVEDEVPLINAMSMRLGKSGYTVIQARDGDEGLKLAIEIKPDLIISDIVMPNSNGFKMIAQLRTDESWGKNVPVIFLTNLNNTKDVTEALELGVFDFLVKSNWKLNDLLNKVIEKIGTPPSTIHEVQEQQAQQPMVYPPTQQFQAPQPQVAQVAPQTNVMPTQPYIQQPTQFPTQPVVQPSPVAPIQQQPFNQTGNQNGIPQNPV